MDQTISSKDSMKESTKAYVAGLLDAEGCLSIYKAVHKTGRVQYTPRIVIANINLPIMKWLVETFGGTFYKKTPERGRVWYQWNLSVSKGAAEFLSDISPYLRIKKQEAIILSKFYDVQKSMDNEILEKLMVDIRQLKNRECSTTEMLDGQIEDKLTHAYLAGIFDGEGCVSVGIAPSGKPILHINIANTYRPLIDFYIKTYGGWIQTSKAKGNNVESYRWWVTKKELQEKFISRVLPYLRIKREQAILALKYVQLPRTDNMREEKTKLAVKIKELNRLKIQPDLIGDYKSDPEEILVAA